MTPDEIEKMKADMEAGTPGPWVSLTGGRWGDQHQIHARTGNCSHWIANLKCESCPVNLGPNARRIARVPQLEVEVLRLRRMLKDARQWNWIDFDEADDNEREGLTEMTFLDREISDTLSDGGDDAA